MMHLSRFSIATFCLLLSTASGFPASSLLSEVFADATIPFLDDKSALSEFNVTSQSSSASISKRALTLNYIKYSITMDGRNQGNFENFLVTGTMLVTDGIVTAGTVNGANPVEVVLSIGSPSVNPVAGSIQYCTNRALYPLFSGSALTVLDFAQVSVEGTTVSVTVDTSLAVSNPLSNFNARSGLTANVYLMASGGFVFTHQSDNTIPGGINLVGQGYLSPGQAPYKALISGQALGKGSFTI
jgi:hypothetical protein